MKRFQMANHETIEKIRAEVRSSGCPLLNRNVMDIHTVDSVSEFFRLSAADKVAYINIPVSSIVSIGRKGDTWMQGDTWRDVVLARLHGDDWPVDVIEYFENNIEDKDFPAPNSKRKLELTCYGGVSVCSNGNHRLAAAYCWLSAKMGAAAELKRVSTSLVPINRVRVDQLKAFLSDNFTKISICNYPSTFLIDEIKRKFFVRVESQEHIAYFACDDRMELIWPPEQSLWEKIALAFSTNANDRDLRIGKCLSAQPWIEVPSIVLKMWSENEWFLNCYEKA